LIVQYGAVDTVAAKAPAGRGPRELIEQVLKPGQK
jgi:hypothetical protein